jgi:hypothetical protein
MPEIIGQSHRRATKAKPAGGEAEAWKRATVGLVGEPGEETFTVPNKDEKRRDRLSLMGRGAPHH